MSYTSEDMLSALRSAGVVAGDCIFVHMALKKLGSFDAGGRIRSTRCSKLSCNRSRRVEP